MQLNINSPDMPACATRCWFGLRAQQRIFSIAALALATALVLGVSACGGNNPEPTALDQIQAAPELTAAKPIAFLDGTFAGKTSSTDMFAAVVTHATGLEAYFCDGKRDFWFRGLASESTIEMTDASGAKLTIDVAKDIAVGRLTVGDVVTTFELPSAPADSLFRADTNVGSSRVLAGWIKLPNGEQRGVIRNGTVSLPSTLDLSQTLAGSNTPDPRATCTDCEALVAALVIAPFTPVSAQVKPNVAQEFTVIGLGDSFMSGEGAPVVYGSFKYNVFANGYLKAFNETWASGLPTSRGQRDFNLTNAQRTTLAREAQACHRGASGLGLAVDGLRQTWPNNIDLIHQTFACSGAKVEHLVSSQYSGAAGCGKLAEEKAVIERDIQREIDRDALVPNVFLLGILNAQLLAKNASYAICKTISDDTDTNSIRAQIPEAAEFLRAQRLKPDAVVMSIGGNDLGFGTIIGECLKPNNDCSNPTGAASTALRTGTFALPDRYTSLASKLNNTGFVGSNTYLTSHPNPLSKNASRTCAGSDFAPDLLLMNMSDEDAAFGVTVVDRINSQVKAAIEVAGRGWKPITSHLNSATNNGMCSSSPWYNTRDQALAQQGEDLPGEILGLNLLSLGDLLPKIELSAGMFHPNQAGQREAYKPAYQAVLDQALVTRFTPKPPTRFRPVAFYKDSAGRTSVEVVWDDVNEFESNSIITNAVGSANERIGRDVTRKIIALGSSNAGQLSIKACLERPGASADLCSASTPPVDVEVRLPTHTPSVTTNTPTAALSFGELVYTSHSLAWSDASPTKIWSTVELEASGVITRQAVLGSSVQVPISAGLKHFRVASCNTLGCGPATPWQDFKPVPQQAFNAPQPCQVGFRRVGAGCVRDNVRP